MSHVGCSPRARHRWGWSLSQEEGALPRLPHPHPHPSVGPPLWLSPGTFHMLPPRGGGVLHETSQAEEAPHSCPPPGGQDPCSALLPRVTPSPALEAFVPRPIREGLETTCLQGGGGVHARRSEPMGPGDGVARCPWGCGGSPSRAQAAHSAPTGSLGCSSPGRPHPRGCGLQRLSLSERAKAKSAPRHAGGLRNPARPCGYKPRHRGSSGAGRTDPRWRPGC